MKCTYCGQGTVFFGSNCSECGRVNRDNTQSMDQFWGRAKGNKKLQPTPARREKSFFRPAWAIPFKLLWLPVRLLWWLVRVPF
jgi:hypothetical protein